MSVSYVNIIGLTEKKTEQQACEEFDRFIESTGLFIVEKEVSGQYLFGNNGMTSSVARIDRILVPRSNFSKTGGLTTGPIGVEIKAVNPEIKWGRPICQAINYRSAAFRIFDGWANIDCILDSIFLYPMHKTAGETESIMSQNRIGNAFIGYGGKMIFQISSTNFLELNKGSSSFKINRNTQSIGRKYGSR